MALLSPEVRLCALIDVLNRQFNHSLPVITPVSGNSYEIHIFHIPVLRVQIGETYAKYLRISHRLFWQSGKIYFRFLCKHIFIHLTSLIFFMGVGKTEIMVFQFLFFLKEIILVV